MAVESQFGHLRGMNDVPSKMTPYSGWSTGTAGRWQLAIAAVLIYGWIFYTDFKFCPTPFEVILLIFIAAGFFGYWAYVAGRFARTDDHQIIRGWRIPWLGECCKSSVTWREVEYTEIRPDFTSPEIVVLIITTRAGRQLEFSAPPGNGAAALHAIHNHYKSPVA